MPLAVGVLGLVLAASGAARTPPLDQSLREASCPSTARSLGAQDIRTTVRILAAVRAGVPRIFRDYTTQGGGPGWHHFQVLGLLSLSGGYSPEPRVITRYRREVVRRCGRAVAFNTWVVLLQFPEGPMASTSNAHMFVAKTRRGWAAWSGSVDVVGF
jgi:hypothetical protein